MTQLLHIFGYKDHKLHNVSQQNIVINFYFPFHLFLEATCSLETSIFVSKNCFLNHVNKKKWFNQFN